MDYVTQLLIKKITGKTAVNFTGLQSLDSTQKGILNQYLDKIKDGYPVDYLLEEVEFCGQIFEIKEGVFIPRWETEWWTNEILMAFKNQDNIFNSEVVNKIQTTPNLVEISSGSGVIGLTLAKVFEKVLACDINPFAVALCKKNMQRLELENYTVFLSDLFKNLEFKSEFEKLTKPWCLVANLPYVPIVDYQSREHNKILFEPPEAIFSGEDGLDLYNDLLGSIALKLPEIAFFELDPRNISAAQMIAKKYFKNSQICRDPDNFDRLLVCWI